MTFTLNDKRAGRAATFLACVMPALLTGCRSASPQSKADSFAQFQGQDVDGAPLPEFLAARTARILISLRETAEPNVYRSEATAAAVPISADGYLLTAAHALDRDSLPSSYVLLSGTQRPLHFRVVWDGFRDTNAHLDIAVIHVEDELPAVFEWAAMTELVSGAELVSAGFSRAEISFAAGSLRDDVQSDGQVAWKVAHDVPLAGGDSGGPLCTPQGKLVAVNYGSMALTPFGGILSRYALRPDPDWLAGLLARDRDGR
ncbi:hypothetical protein Poly30_51190 [Planctomycetes bacterium Poly30]|uniref:Trypsin n=1 Tax=Saltatorellus ferox TaxID=2528018 RepID=A0A518EZR0_9BACT|nr:hypothetical protein Poly30_51190 [Planctomycetes bacterium Poly30]